MITSFKPGEIALVTGDYGQGKSTLVKGMAYSFGRAAIFSAPSRLGAPPDFSDIARVVHDKREMEKACRECPFVVWPAPPSSAGQAAIDAALNDFSDVVMGLRDVMVVYDELQNKLRSKFLKDAPPRFQDVVELGHKAPGRLAKVFVAHRLAQIPLVLGGGAYRISFRPFPGDDDALRPFFGDDGLAKMKRFGVGTFAYWSQKTGAILPVKARMGTGPVDPRASKGGA